MIALVIFRVEKLKELAAAASSDTNLTPTSSAIPGNSIISYFVIGNIAFVKLTHRYSLLK